MISRRVVLRSAVWVPAASVVGCTPLPPQTAPSPAADPDVAIAQRLGALISGTLAVARRHRSGRNADLAAACVALHEAHLTQWPVALAESADSPQRRLLPAERALRAASREAVVDFTDPGFARRVASMTAASAQLLGQPAPEVAEPDAALDPAAALSLLTLEREAVWRWEWLAGASVPPLRALCFTELWEHRARRDRAEAAVQEGGGSLPPAPTAYDVRVPQTRAEAWAEASGTVHRLMAGYADLVAASTGSWRAQATMWLENAAIRDLAFRGTPGMFPGER